MAKPLPITFADLPVGLNPLGLLDEQFGDATDGAFMKDETLPVSALDAGAIGNGLTISGTSIAIDTSVTADLTSAQTLENKTLVTPDLGTPSVIDLTNATGLGSVGSGAGVLPTINNGFPIADRAAAAALDPTKYFSVYLYAEGTRSGTWNVVAGSIPVSDPQGGVYFASGTAGYYFARAGAAALLKVEWFDTTGGAATDLTTAMQAALNFQGAVGLGVPIVLDATNYQVSALLTTTTNTPVAIIGVGPQTTITWVSGSTTGGISGANNDGLYHPWTLRGFTLVTLATFSASYPAIAADFTKTGGVFYDVEQTQFDIENVNIKNGAGGQYFTVGVRTTTVSNQYWSNVNIRSSFVTGTVGVENLTDPSSSSFCSIASYNQVNIENVDVGFKNDDFEGVFYNNCQGTLVNTGVRCHADNYPGIAEVNVSSCQFAYVVTGVEYSNFTKFCVTSTLFYRRGEALSSTTNAINLTNACRDGVIGGNTFASTVSPTGIMNGIVVGSSTTGTLIQSNVHRNTSTVGGTCVILNGINNTVESQDLDGAGSVISYTSPNLISLKPQSWNPSLSFDTPGDLTLSGVTIAGFYNVTNGMLHVEATITATVNYTTASGSLIITNFPFNSSNNSDSLHIYIDSAITYPTGRTQISGRLVGGIPTVCRIHATGSGQAGQDFTTATVGTGTQVSLRISGDYIIA